MRPGPRSARCERAACRRWRHFVASPERDCSSSRNAQATVLRAPSPCDHHVRRGRAVCTALPLRDRDVARPHRRRLNSLFTGTRLRRLRRLRAPTGGSIFNPAHMVQSSTGLDRRRQPSTPPTAPDSTPQASAPAARRLGAASRRNIERRAVASVRYRRRMRHLRSVGRANVRFRGLGSIRGQRSCSPTPLQPWHRRREGLMHERIVGGVWRPRSTMPRRSWRRFGPGQEPDEVKAGDLVFRSGNRHEMSVAISCGQFLRAETRPYARWNHVVLVLDAAGRTAHSKERGSTTAG